VAHAILYREVAKHPADATQRTFINGGIIWNMEDSEYLLFTRQTSKLGASPVAQNPKKES